MATRQDDYATTTTCIIDEVDSTLIDEVENALIISGPIYEDNPLPFKSAALWYRIWSATRPM